LQELDSNIIGVTGVAAGAAVAIGMYLLQRFTAGRSVFYTEARALYDLVREENVRLRDVNADLDRRLAECLGVRED
jgi:hypothetical protein